MEDLDGFADLESFSLQVCSTACSFKSGSLVAQQKLDTVQNDLPFSDMSKVPQCTFIVIDSGKWLQTMDLVYASLELFQQIEGFSEAWLLRIIIRSLHHYFIWRGLGRSFDLRLISQPLAQLLLNLVKCAYSENLLQFLLSHFFLFDLPFSLCKCQEWLLFLDHVKI